MNLTTSASIIVNNFNYERFLTAAIESALRQTRAALEVIVVDDGSSDRSRDVIASFGGRVKPVFKPNGGQGSAFNAGFRESGGDVIVFLDADDLLLPTALETVLARFDAERLAKVHWPLRIIDADGKAGGLLPDRELPQGDFRDTLIREGPDSYLSTPTSGNAWSRLALERVLPVPEEEFRQGADGYLLSVTPLYGRIGRLTEPQSRYRVHGCNQYWTDALDERVERSLQRYEARGRALQRRLATDEIDCDPDEWRRRSAYYQWMREVQATAEQIKAVIPTGSTYVLVDDQQFGPALTTGRRAIPLVERDGVAWGPPADDEEAVSALRRAIDSRGARFIAFTRAAFWWLDHYQVLRSHLSDGFRRVLSTAQVIVYQPAEDRGG